MTQQGITIIDGRDWREHEDDELGAFVHDAIDRCAELAHTDGCDGPSACTCETGRLVPLAHDALLELGRRLEQARADLGHMQSLLDHAQREIKALQAESAGWKRWLGRPG